MSLNFCDRLPSSAKTHPKYINICSCLISASAIFNLYFGHDLLLTIMHSISLEIVFSFLLDFLHYIMWTLSKFSFLVCFQHCIIGISYVLEIEAANIKFAGQFEKICAAYFIEYLCVINKTGTRLIQRYY